MESLHDQFVLRALIQVQNLKGQGLFQNDNCGVVSNFLRCWAQFCPHLMLPQRISKNSLFPKKGPVGSSGFLTRSHRNEILLFLVRNTDKQANISESFRTSSIFIWMQWIEGYVLSDAKENPALLPEIACRSNPDQSRSNPTPSPPFLSQRI